MSSKGLLSIFKPQKKSEEPKPILTRNEVYTVINSERDYQDNISGNMEHRGFPTVEAELLMMEHYVAEARREWVNTHGNPGPALEMMRKVAGIAVRCFEHHGCPPRNTKSSVIEL